MKAKPKLTDLLLNFKKALEKEKIDDPSLTEEQRIEKTTKKRNQLKKKLLALYDDSESKLKKKSNDIDKINKNIQAIKRKSDYQWTILESLDKKIT